MWSHKFLTTIYKATVIPVTMCTVTLSVYTAGYADHDDILRDRREFTMFQFARRTIESAMFGYCVGIMYPVGIPACIGYLYLTET